VTESRLHVLHLVRYETPDTRRSRRGTRTTKVKKILVLRKRADSIHAVDRKPIAVDDAPASRPKPGRRRRNRKLCANVPRWRPNPAGPSTDARCTPVIARHGDPRSPRKEPKRDT
jgi:hypothetical protein